MKLNFPQFSLFCHKKIEDSGFSAWFVGGCVRDALLSRPFTDIDIATNATPDDIIKIFDKTIPTGIKHGTVTVIIDNNPIEVTTFRAENGYQDSRHPDSVEFKNDINEDLSRRDFTVNAIAYHPNGRLVDNFGGIKDLEIGIIRCVNDPYTRFNEDALRILRAYRFASQLTLKIEEKTEKAALDLTENLKLLSGERILRELKKLVCGKNVGVITPLISKGALKFCGINNNCTDFSLIDTIPDSADRRFPIFLNLCGFDSDLIKTVLKIDNKTYNSAIKLNEILSEEKPTTKAEIKLLLYKYESFVFELYLKYLSISSQYDCKEIKEFYNEIINNYEPYKLSHLDINGIDIEQLGFKGNTIGEQMQKLLKQVIINPEINKKEILLSLIKI